jgi:hypothetical protein
VREEEEDADEEEDEDEVAPLGRRTRNAALQARAHALSLARARRKPPPPPPHTLGRRTRRAFSHTHALPPSRAHTPALQAKLDALASLAAAGRVRDFCAAFVPLDLSPEDAAHFATGLEADPERCAPAHTTHTAHTHTLLTWQRTRAETRAPSFARNNE